MTKGGTLTMRRASGALRGSVVAAAGIAVCGVAANSAASALHEVFGHGLAAIASGGRFLSFFVSPTAAFAETATSDVGALWMNAAGTPVNVITGLLAYGALKRRRDLSTLASLALWQFTHTSLVFQLLYVGGPPLGLWLADQAPQGDWSVLFSRLGVHPLVAAVVFVPLSVVAAAKLARMSERLTPWPVAGWRRVGTVAAYLSLVLPPLMLIILYALVALPWSTPRDHFEAGGMIVTPLSAGLAGALVAQLRRARADDRAAAASPGIVSPVTPKALAILIALLCGAGWVFGPTTGLRRGIAVQQPTPDDYFRAAQDLRITVTLGKSGGGPAASQLPTSADTRITSRAKAVGTARRPRPVARRRGKIHRIRGGDQFRPHEHPSRRGATTA